MTTTLVLGLVFLLGSGFFSGLETAIVSLHRPRVRSFFERGSRRAHILEGFLRDREKLLTTTLLGTNLCNVSASVMAVRFGESLAPWGGAAGGGVIFILLLFFGEFIPKVLFRRRPTYLALLFAYPLWWCFVLFKPVVIFTTSTARGLLWLLHIPAEGHNPMVTREELKLLIRRGEIAGTLTPKERELVHSVLDTRGRRLSEVMLPIEQVVYVDSDTTVGEAVECCRRSGYSRIPIIDRLARPGEEGGGPASRHVIGFFNLYDVLFRLEPTDFDAAARDFARPARFMGPETTVSSALQRLRSARQPIAVVGYEVDSIAVGLVTVEDLLRVVIGRVEA